MSMRHNEIGDDEIRVIGKPSENGGKRRSLWKMVMVCGAALVLIALVLWICLGHAPGKEVRGETIYEPEMYLPEPTPPAPAPAPVTTPSVLCDTLYSNGLALQRLMPVNLVPELMIDRPDTLDEGIFLAAQAADIRRDNGKIVGAYVIAGKPVAWGLSKRGYAAILDGKLSVGVADNSPLFEKATETGGYFFRQYPLVDNTVAIENNPKNKAVRKALCQTGEECFIVVCWEPVTLTVFASALAAAGIENAISLVGGNSNGFVRHPDGRISHLGDPPGVAYRYENYILWRTR